MTNFKRFISLGLILYLLLIARLIIFKFPDAMTADILQRWTIDGALRNLSGANLIPFTTIWDDLFNAALPVQLPNLLYNIMAFVPSGFFISLIFERRRLIIVLSVAFIISMLFELIQIFTLLGTGDIDDVILNMTGAVVGYGMFTLAAWGQQYFDRCAARYR